MPSPICPSPEDLRIKCVNTNEGVNGLTITDLATLIGESVPNIGQRVFVRTMDDFPDPVNGVITLEIDTNYFIVGVGLLTPDRFQWTGGTVSMTGLWTVGKSQLTYTGTGNMFTALNAALDISRINMNCPNGNFFFNQSVPPNPFNGLKASGVIVQICQTIVEIDGGAATIDDGACFSCVNGFDLKTSVPFAFSLRQFNVVDLAGGVALNLNSSVWDVFEVRDFIINSSTGGVGLQGLPNSGNVPVGRIATYETSEFGSTLTPLSGISIDDIRWNFTDNVGIPNTSQRALNNIQNNAILTALTQNVPAPVVGAWTLINFSQFSQGAANTSQLVYTGERPAQFNLDITVTLLADTATPLIQVDAYLNGSPVAGATTKIESSSISNETGGLIWSGELVQDDVFEIFLTNLDNDDDVALTDGTTRLTLG